MQIEVDASMFNDLYFTIKNCNKRIHAIYGSAGSGKSHSVGQYILLERNMATQNDRTLIVRKVKRTIRESSFRLLQYYISVWGLSQYFEINKSEMSIKNLINGNEIISAGLDDAEKIKSIEGITTIWVEEASEISFDDFRQLNLRMRGLEKNYKMILTYNPVSTNNWTYEDLYLPITKNIYHDGINSDNFYQQNTELTKVLYSENKFLDADYKSVLESLTGLAKLVYCDGEYGSPENVIYTNWDIISEFPKADTFVYGLDFGFTNPQALVRIYKNENDFYVQEISYARKQTIPELADFCKEVLPYEHVIYADSESPQNIEELRNKGLNVIPVKKGAGSVFGGINYLRGLNLHFVSGSENLIKEVQSYSLKKDPYGKVIDNQTEKSMDHGMDAMRYGAQFFMEMSDFTIGFSKKGIK